MVFKDACAQWNFMRRIRLAALALLGTVAVGLTLVALLPRSPRNASISISDVGKAGAMAMIYAYGQEKGVFERYGLNVTFLSFPDAYTSMVAFSAGKADVMTSSPVLAATSYSQGERFSIGMAVGEATENMLIVQPGIEVAQDLAGKRIGVMGRVSDSYYQTNWYLESKGLGMETDAEVIEIKNPAALVTSFENGQLDAVVLWANFAAEALASGGECLVTCSDALEEVIGHPAYLPLIIVGDDFLAERERTAREFFRAIRQVVIEIEQNPEEAAEIRAQFSGMPLEKITDSMEMMTLVGDLSPAIIDDIVAFWDHAIQRGCLESAPGKDAFYDGWR